MSTAAHARAGRDRARQKRLKAARERRLRLDPDESVREQRIDAATVDVELAWEARAEVQRAGESAEVAAAVAVVRLLEERLTGGDVVKLTGLDQPAVRRLRKLAVRRLRKLAVRRLRKLKASIRDAPALPEPTGQRTEG